MAKLLPQTFPDPGTAAITSYSFIEVADGTGVAVFYAGKRNEGGSASGGILASQQFYSTPVLTYQTITLDANYSLGAHQNFYATFNRPINVKGQCLVTIPFGIKANDAFTYSMFASGALVKVSGGVDTTLFRLSGAITTKALTDDEYVYALDTIGAELPFTHFKKGDQLKLEIQILAKGGAAGNDVMLGHDPQSRALNINTTTPTFGTEETTLTLNLPIQLDL